MSEVRPQTKIQSELDNAINLMIYYDKENWAMNNKEVRQLMAKIKTLMWVLKKRV